jgi:NTP pyrophosphatase (non-canonical NTP hydrolase)
VQLPELQRLVSVMARLRQECPWDAQQTHRSLVQYLIEETAETVEAIENGDLDHLREELGDLLLQVIFHAQIASEEAPGFTVEDVARDIADKLISRHPYVFATAEVPVDLHYTWEQRKAAEKGRTSALQGIPEQQLSVLARAHKIISKARSRQPALRQLESTPSRRCVVPYAVWKPGFGMLSRRPRTRLRLSNRRLSCGHVRASAATAGPPGASAPELSSAELPSAELSPSELPAPELLGTESARSAIPVESRRALSGAAAVSAHA